MDRASGRRCGQHRHGRCAHALPKVRPCCRLGFPRLLHTARAGQPLAFNDCFEFGIQLCLQSWTCERTAASLLPLHLTFARPWPAPLAGNPPPRVAHAVLTPEETQFKRVIIVGDIHGCPGEPPPHVPLPRGAGYRHQLNTRTLGVAQHAAAVATSFLVSPAPSIILEECTERS